MNFALGNSWKVIFEPCSAADFGFDEFADNFFGAVTVDYTDDGKEQYSGYLPSEPDEGKMRQFAENFGVVLPEYKIEFVPAANWLKKNVIKFPPLETDDFLIYGSHEDCPPQSDKLKLRIYAATAFGSGQHHTTRSCLEFLSRLKTRGFMPDNILDMGCGSGILALAACRLWSQAKALGADIDDEAVAVTLHNAAENELSERIHAVQSNGFDNSQIFARSPYQLILSNILARPLIDMASDLSQNLAVGGFAVLSGFIDEQVEWVKEAYQRCGLYPLEVIAAENWRALLLEKRK